MKAVIYFNKGKAEHALFDRMCTDAARYVNDVFSDPDLIYEIALGQEFTEDHALIESPVSNGMVVVTQSHAPFEKITTTAMTNHELALARETGEFEWTKA